MILTSTVTGFCNQCEHYGGATCATTYSENGKIICYVCKGHTGFYTVTAYHPGEPAKKRPERFWVQKNQAPRSARFAR